ALDEPCLDQRGIAAALDDLAEHPVEVLMGLIAAWQRVHRVLDGDRAEPLQPAPDLHPEVVRLGRDLVDEEQPARLFRRLASVGHRAGYRAHVSSVNTACGN